MATVRELIGKVNVTSYLLKHHAAPRYAIDWANRNRIPGMFYNEYKHITILVANVNGQTRSRFLEMVKEYQPMFVFIIEPYAIKNPPVEYHLIEVHHFYKNCLWIRNDIRKTKVISRIPFGIRVDNIAFRYIPPNSAPEKLELEEIEVGDFNFLSNKWLYMENIICEYRQGKPGGVAIASKYEKKAFFTNIGSDHDAMYAQIKATIKPKKKVDVNKLQNAIQDAIYGKTNKDIYVLDQRWHEDRQIIVRNNQKLVNPKAKKLDIQPYKDIYHDNPLKRTNAYYVPKIRENKSQNIQSKAEDVNNFQIKKMIQLTQKLTLPQKERVLYNFRWIQFNSRTVFLQKKGKEPNKITNLRPIQISPWNFKIAEQSRKKLKDWLDQNTSDKCYAFKRRKKIIDLIAWIKSHIRDG